MALPTFAAGIDIVSNERVTRPPKVQISTRAPSAHELDAIELPDYGLTTASKASKPTIDETSVSKTPSELEQSQPSTPQGHEGADIVPTLWYPKMNRWRLSAACMQYFGNGLNDSAPGALIPYIEDWYGIGYAVVSTIWISNAGKALSCARYC